MNKVKEKQWGERFASNIKENINILNIYNGYTNF